LRQPMGRMAPLHETGQCGVRVFRATGFQRHSRLLRVFRQSGRACMGWADPFAAFGRETGKSLDTCAAWIPLGRDGGHRR
ncbi:MAG TPA: hypothetical protein PLD23_09910, partial [Armatimonadota bacterium]|nr:hypothetical protein [Armatimonadota bacterium]